MRLASVQITNYKSFLSSPTITLSPGFNVIVGQNNVGKTAFVEALGLALKNIPHRSLKTVPTVTSILRDTPEITLTFEVPKTEFTDIFKDHLVQFSVPLDPNGSI